MIAAELSPNYAQQYVAKPRALVESGGFDVEYHPEVDEQALRDDIFSYLAEHRLRVGRYDYVYTFTQDAQAGLLLDSKTGESMSEKTKRAILQKRAEGEDSTREEADDYGMNSLIQKIATTQVGDGIWWGSLPGRKEDGFGTYAFIYVGQIVRSLEIRDEITNEVVRVKKQIEMSAIRVENPDIASFNQAYEELTGVSINARSPEDLLREPVVISGVNKDYLEGSIRDKFEVNGADEEREWIEQTRLEFNPAIDDFIYLVRSRAPVWRKLEAVHTMEKHADKLRKLHERGELMQFNFIPNLEAMRYEYRNTPLEHAAGSCPMSKKSGNIFGSSYELLNKSVFGESGVCSCGRSNEDKHYHCPKCGKDYANETGKEPSQRTKECLGDGEPCGFKFGC